MPCFGRPIKVLPEGQNDERSSDQILDDYLANTSYYQQTWLSIDAAASSVWRKQVRVADSSLANRQVAVVHRLIGTKSTTSRGF